MSILRSAEIFGNNGGRFSGCDELFLREDFARGLPWDTLLLEGEGEDLPAIDYKIIARTPIAESNICL